MKLTYEQWKKAVDDHMWKLYGLHSDDLNDWRYAADYNEGRSPASSAKRAYANALKS